MSDIAIKVHKLSKDFHALRHPWKILVPRRKPKGKPALHDVTFSLKRSEILGVIGSNGAGKTTLLKVLSTLIVPTSGFAEVFGLDLIQQANLVRRRVGWCLDTERSFYFRLSGMQNLEFFATLNGLRPRDAKTRIQELQGLLGIKDEIRKPFGTYSWGMRQKLGLARALLADPPVILLDEPTKSLDPIAADEFRGLFRDILAKKLSKTLLLVTHNLDEARDCCDQIVLMTQGRISCFGPWPQVSEHIGKWGFADPDVEFCA